MTKGTITVKGQVAIHHLHSGGLGIGHGHVLAFFSVFFFPFYVCLGEGTQNGDGEDDDDVTEMIEIQGRLGERRRRHCAFLDPE